MGGGAQLAHISSFKTQQKQHPHTDQQTKKGEKSSHPFMIFFFFIIYLIFLLISASPFPVIIRAINQCSVYVKNESFLLSFQLR